MIQTIDVDRIKQNVDLREMAAGRVHLHRVSGKELAGPCPKCGGDDRFHCTAEWFFCRQCRPERGDAVEYTRWLDGVDFKEACARLAGGVMPTYAGPVRRPEPRPKTEQAPKWEGEAIDIVRRGANILNKLPKGELGRQYLLSRGIEPETWQAFGLGYLPAVSLPHTYYKEKKEWSHPRQPAIVIPWYQSGKLRGVRYRFLQEHEYTDIEGNTRKAKKTALWESDFAGILFGEQALNESASVLVLCEGELNAASIWQVAKDKGVNVLSIGSESASLSPEDIESASKYAHVLTWLDKRERAAALMLDLPGASGTQSPKGKDANDWLQAGKLGDLVFGMLKRMGWTPAEEPPAEIGDVTDFVGATVDLPTLVAIQRRLERLGWHADIQELEGQRSTVKWLYTYDAPFVDGLQRIGTAFPL